MKSLLSRLKQKNIHYRNSKRFDKQKFIANVKNADAPIKKKTDALLKKKNSEKKPYSFHYKGFKKSHLHKK